MPYPYELKPKPWWLSVTGPDTWVTLSPYIYYTKGTDPTLSPDRIEHEKVHIQQQGDTGKWVWLVRYFFNKSFRFEQELAAYRVQLLCIPVSLRSGFIQEIAGWLSGSMYSECATREEAVAALSKDIPT